MPWGSPLWRAWGREGGLSSSLPSLVGDEQALAAAMAAPTIENGSSDGETEPESELLSEEELLAQSAAALLTRPPHLPYLGMCEVYAKLSTTCPLSPPCSPPDSSAAESDGEDGVGEGAEAAGIDFGSADPHRVGDVDGVPPRVRDGLPTFSVSRLSAAGGEELLGRRLPILNASVPTLAPEPSDGGLPEPPVVWWREEVVPAATQRLVASWLRRQRSCCAAARRGNLELARRLKPSDLWLDWEEHSVAATRAWAWDLRPLERGLPAIPLGAVPTRPRTGIRLEAVEEARGWCVDKAILHELEWGIRDDADLPMGTLLCAPHGGALKFIVQAEEKVAKSVAAGWVTIHSDLPMWPIRCPPGSVVDETERAGRAKHRATDDLSWPHAGCVGAPSSNDAMRRHEWAPVTHVRVPQLASAAATFETVGPLRGGCHACRIWGWDATAYYKVMARAVDEVWRQCRVDPRGRFGVDERAVFGCAAAAVKGGGHASNVIAQAVQRRLQAFDDAHPPSDPAVRSWLAARRRLLAGEAEAEVSRLFVFGVYVDDGCGLSVDDELGLTTSTGGRWRRAAWFITANSAVPRCMSPSSSL